MKTCFSKVGIFSFFFTICNSCVQATSHTDWHCVTSEKCCQNVYKLNGQKWCAALVDETGILSLKASIYHILVRPPVDLYFSVTARFTHLRQEKKLG